MSQLPLREICYVRRLAHSLTPNVHDADDAVQDTWMVALQQRPNRIDNQRAWLRTVVRSRVLDRHRSRLRRQHHESTVHDSRCAPSSEDLVVQVDLFRSLDRALAELEPMYREVIELRFLRSQPPRRIAAGLGIPVETVRTRSKRALRQLRSQLALHGVFDA